jgi:MFS family permease
MLGQAGYLYTYYVFASWLPSYLVLQRKMTVLNSGFVGMLPFIVGVLVTVAGGWTSDRMVVSGMRVTVVRKALSVGGLFGAAFFTLLGAYSSGVWPAVTFLTLAIASFSFATGAIQSMAVDIAPSHMVSSLAALQNVGGNVAGSFAPVVTGLLISASGNFQVPLLVTAAIALVFGCGGFGLIVGNLDHTLASPAAKSAPA